MGWIVLLIIFILLLLSLFKKGKGCCSTKK